MLVTFTQDHAGSSRGRSLGSIYQLMEKTQSKISNNNKKEKKNGKSRLIRALSRISQKMFSFLNILLNISKYFRIIFN